MQSTQQRIAEVEWEDSISRHGWSDRLVRIAGPIRSVGYVEKDDDEGVILLSGMGDTEVTSDPYDCSTFIPRSAIRKVTELTRVGVIAESE